MDPELKTCLDGMEARLGERVDTAIRASEEHFNTAIRASEERLRNVLAGGIAVLHNEMRDGFERIDTRLNRQGEMLTNGARALSSLVDYVERADANYARLLREMEDLRARVAIIEKKVA